MLRILAFDVGERRIGVAVSDMLGITAQGIETYHRTDDLERDVEHLIQLANRYKPAKLVFGMPRNMDGSYGMQAEITRTFADAVLAKWDGDHAFQDERLTTASARPWFTRFHSQCLQMTTHPYYRAVCMLIDFFTKEEQ